MSNIAPIHAKTGCWGADFKTLGIPAQIIQITQPVPPVDAAHIQGPGLAFTPGEQMIGN